MYKIFVASKDILLTSKPSKGKKSLTSDHLFIDEGHSQHTQGSQPPWHDQVP